MNARIVALLAALLLGLGAPVRAASDAAVATEAAAELLEQAGFALLEADGARDRVAALTRTLRAYEEGIAALRAGIGQARLREQAILTVFEAERDRLTRLLAVLQGLEAAPAPLALIHPEGPVGGARTSMIVADVTPAVAAEARALRQQLEELATLRVVQETALAQLATALDRAQDARSQLSQAIAARGDLPENFTRDQAAMVELLGSVDQLDAIAGAQATEPATQPGTVTTLPDFAAARGRLPLPVQGTRLHDFGADPAARPGLVYATQAGAPVIAPWPARVRFAGPFSDYGNVIILEPAGGYLLILAGLGVIHTGAGSLVDAGTALGVMPGEPGSDGEDVQELTGATPQGGSAERMEALYIELRENGMPVDPAPWITDTGRD